MDINQYIKEHTALEFKYRSRSLCESGGVPDFISDAVDSLMNRIMEKIRAGERDRYADGIFDIKADGLFFDICRIEMSILIDKPSDAVSICWSDGGYVPDRSGDADGKYMIYILITAGGNADMLDEEIRILLAHEITHAYNDYMTRNAGKINPIQCGRADGTVLHKNYMNPDQIIRYMHDIIYFSLKSETDAMQSEIFMEMSRKKGYMSDRNNIEAVMSGTAVMKRIKRIADELSYIESLTEPDGRKKAVDFFNAVYHTNVTDFNSITRKIKTLFFKSRSKIIQSACKSAFMLHETWYAPVRMNGEWLNVFDWTQVNDADANTAETIIQ